MFSNKDLKKMILPLFFEQFLVMLVGIADTFVISYAGEAAVSGVSLVNSFNTIFIYLFTALASGGAVIISQYVGKGDKAAAGEAASQLFTASAIISIVLGIFVLLFNRPLMGLMFGKVETDVMDACVTYFLPTPIPPWRSITPERPFTAVLAKPALLCTYPASPISSMWWEI